MLSAFKLRSVQLPRESFRFYGVPETGEEEEEVLKVFLEKELNVAKAGHIKFQRVCLVGKKDRNTKTVGYHSTLPFFKDREELSSHQVTNLHGS